MALAGRAAEQVNFGKVTTGAANDLQRVTQVNTTRINRLFLVKFCRVV